jgi:hypothetical protein
MSGRMGRDHELVLSSSGLLGLLRLAAKGTGRTKRDELTYGGNLNRMAGEDVHFLLQAGYLEERGKWVEVSDQGNALVRELLVFAQTWKGGKES